MKMTELMQVMLDALVEGKRDLEIHAVDHESCFPHRRRRISVAYVRAGVDGIFLELDTVQTGASPSKPEVVNE